MDHQKNFFWENLKKILNFDLKKRKNSLYKKDKDQKNKKYHEKQKQKIFIEIIKKIKKKSNINIQLFGIFFFAIKLGYFFFILKLILKNYGNNFYFEHFWIILTLWESERNKKKILPQEFIFTGILINSSLHFLPKEYFRQKIFIFRLFFLYFRVKKNFKKHTKTFLSQKSCIWMFKILKKILWSFFCKYENDLFLENLLQISSKEIWTFNSIFFLNENLTDLIKMIVIDKINLIDNLKFVYIPKILSFGNNLLKCVTKKFLYIYIFIPKNEIFVNFIEKKIKKNYLNHLYLFNSRNNIQFVNIKLI